MSETIGVDAYRAGWVAIVLDRGRYAGAERSSRLAELIGRHRRAAAIAVDMPIGLPHGRDPRPADLQAWTFVGSRRRSSVFEAARDEVLTAKSHPEATALSRRLTGRGISQQAWRLGPKTLEVAPLAVSDRELRWSERTWGGQAERRALLRSAGIDLPEDLGQASEIPSDDVLDAAVAAWSADRYAREEATCWPAGTPRGGRTAIWY